MALKGERGKEEIKSRKVEGKRKAKEERKT
jgi:hypothetical protein